MSALYRVSLTVGNSTHSLTLTHSLLIANIVGNLYSVRTLTSLHVSVTGGISPLTPRVKDPGSWQVISLEELTTLLVLILFHLQFYT